MTVDDLRAVLKGLPGNLKIALIYAGVDDRNAHVATTNGRYLMLCDSADEIGSTEEVLFDETQEEFARS